MAGPLTATINGLEISLIAVNTRVKASRVWKTRSGRESSTEMPAENVFCDESSMMHLMSPRPLRLSMASASSVIIGTVSTLYCGWFSVIFATNVCVLN